MFEYITITFESNANIKYNKYLIQRSLINLPFEVFFILRPNQKLDLCVRYKNWDSKNAIEIILNLLNDNNINSYVEPWHPQQGENVIYNKGFYKFVKCRLTECCISKQCQMWVYNKEIQPLLIYGE